MCPHKKCNGLHKDPQKRTCDNFVSFGKMCGTTLGYEANLAHGKKKWKPFKTYHFYAPSNWLKKFYSSAEFTDLLYQGTRTETQFISDVYDGQIWKDFQSTNFFASKFNVGLMLYVDWFKPFKRSEYTVGALMLTVLNLPRTERSKRKWTMIAGGNVAIVGGEG